MISTDDMNELRRISTNASGDDRACINRLIRGILSMGNETSFLKNEVTRLKEELRVAKGA